MTKIGSWGRLAYDDHSVVPLSVASQISATIADSQKPGIAYGLGRSYGDVCLNPKRTLWQLQAMDNFCSFDDEEGVLVCESGVVLGDIQSLMMPKGWMLPVTPGTQWVTVGGAVANDVHGKNHHQMGTFGLCVRQITLVRTSGEVVECGPHQNVELFRATIGGLGLTGVISHVSLQLVRCESQWIEAETIAFSNLSEFFQIADQSELSWPYTVAWVDCSRRNSQRGIFTRGDFSGTVEYKRKRNSRMKVPITPPVSFVNQLTLKPFNQFYYHFKRWKSGKHLMHYQPFFYPLDQWLSWNKLYGPRGFYQYQSVVPHKDRLAVTQAMMEAIASSGQGSLLAVLKTFGKIVSPGMLSFPIHGVTLAIDFPNCGQKTLSLFKTLDAIVIEAGGRLYPAKDARMSRELFKRSYPNYDQFLAYRDIGMSSAWSRRVIDE